MELMFVSLTIICHISPLCHSFIAALQLGLLECHNSTRNALKTCITYNEVYIIMHQSLENIETFSSRLRPRPFFMSSRRLVTKTKVSRLHP